MKFSRQARQSPLALPSYFAHLARSERDARAREENLRRAAEAAWQVPARATGTTPS